MTKVLDDIEKLVADVAGEAVSDGKTMQEKMDALKLLTPYYAILKKVKGASDDESGEPTMDDIRRGLRVVAQEPADGSGIEASGRRDRNSV